MTAIIVVLLAAILPAKNFGGGFTADHELKAAAKSFNRTAKEVLQPAYPRLAEAIVDELSLQDRSGTGVDIGGGPGDLVLELSSLTPCFFWLDVDLNPFFAEYLFRGALDQGCSERVSFIQADVHKLPFRSDFADVVVSRGSLQQWKDWELAFSEILRILKPGGKAYIGRGFSANLPIETARDVRGRQGGGPRYDPEAFAGRLRGIMNDLDIKDYELKRPKSQQDEVNYGVWIVFRKAD